MSAAATASPPVARTSSRRQPSYNTPERSSHHRTPSASRHSTTHSDSQRPNSNTTFPTRGSSMSQQHGLAAVARRDYEQSNVAQAQATRRSSSRDGSQAPTLVQRSDSHRTETTHRAESSRGTHRSDSRHGNSRYSADVSRTAPPAYTGSQRGDPTQRRNRSQISTSNGTWLLGKTIGAGSMGKVKLAKNAETGEQVAIKIVPRGTTSTEKSSREQERTDAGKEIRTAREAAICTLLKHPYISDLHDYVKTTTSWWMVFEYINGGQMLDYIISHGRLKEKNARKFARQIASALDYCHRNSIVHRDLKIENILISKTGDIKIIDFGLSNLFKPRGHLKTFCGSLYFAAPELLNAKQYTGPEVDVWSFGIVLYVLVCGKVPFDDQSMPQLHEKIKKGVVEYPGWLTSECKNLISRMLVKDPRQRASLAEVMNHPWITKGFNCAPENYLPRREPLQLPLDEAVIRGMDGFEFGSPDRIREELTRVIESEEYQSAVHQMQREMSASTPGQERKRGVFDFYKRRNSTSRDTLPNMSSEAVNFGADPIHAFSPLISIYYLVREKLEIDTKQDRSRLAQSRLPSEKPIGTPELAAPPAAYTNSNTYEMPGEKPSGGRSRPRARTHGEDDAPEAVKKPQAGRSSDKVAPAIVTTPAPQQPTIKKEGMAGGLLRRFSTRKGPRENVRNDANTPPTLNVQPPSEGSTLMRRGLSIRKSRKDPSTAPTIHSAGSQPQQSKLLKPNKLTRSASVKSDYRRRHGQYDTTDGLASPSAEEPPMTSGSDRSGGAALPKVKINEPPTTSTTENKSSITRNITSRTKSLGHARRESIQARRARRGEAKENHVPEETDEDVAVGDATDGESQAEIKPVYLKGLFSVSTTSSKPLSVIRADLVRVFKQMGVEYTDIKGGFSCRHAPSIDLNKIQDMPTSPDPQGFTPTHRRRISFGGLMGGDRDKDEPQRTPRTPTHRRGPDTSFTNSEDSDEDRTVKSKGPTDRAAGETSTHVQTDMGENMVLRFEVFIVKVPLFSLHGIQFKKMAGGTWQYKNMAQKILDALRL